ncbi:hypothetical protein R83H12_03019 [Fibrobacteria bacterium R8-3-H12]
MLVNCTTKVTNVSGLTFEEEQRILDFLYGMVYAQCANAPDKWFSVRTLLGADNFEWCDIPLTALYEKYKNRGKNNEEAIDLAGKDAGKLLKKVIANEPSRKFEIKYEEHINQYKWIK